MKKCLTRNETLSRKAMEETECQRMMVGKRTDVILDDGTPHATLVYSEEDDIQGDMEDFAISTMMKLGIDVKNLPTMTIKTAEGELSIKGRLEEFAEMQLNKLNNPQIIEPKKEEE